MNDIVHLVLMAAIAAACWAFCLIRVKQYPREFAFYCKRHSWAVSVLLVGMDSCDDGWGDSLPDVDKLELRDRLSHLKSDA